MSHLLLLYVVTILVPRHLPLLALEPILLVEAHIRLLAVQCDLVAIIRNRYLLKHANQAHSQPLSSVGAVHCGIFYVSALLIV